MRNVNASCAVLRPPPSSLRCGFSHPGSFVKRKKFIPAKYLVNFVKAKSWKIMPRIAATKMHDFSLYREFFKDNLKVTCTVDDITTVRNYKRVP